MRTLFAAALPAVLFWTYALAAHAQTSSRAPDESFPLPAPSSKTAELGPVTIEPMDVAGVAVAEDQRGFMWFAGHTGLSRYDGYEYEHFQHNPQDPTSIASNRLESLYVDGEGVLWVGTFGGGLSRFDDATETFTNYQHDPGDSGSLSQDTVTVILEDSRGTLWIGTHDGLNRFDRESATFTRYQHDPDDPTSLSNDQVRTLYEDSRGTLWVGTGSPEQSETPANGGGLNRFNPASGTFTRYLHDARDETSLIHNQVMSIYEDSRGTFWVGTLGDGLHTMDREAGTFTRHRYDPNDPTKLSRPFVEGSSGVPEGCTSWACGGVSVVFEDSQGMLWIGALGGGVNRYDLETGVMSHHEAATSSLDNNIVWNMTESSDGTLWVGTWNVMHKLTAAASAFPHVVPEMIAADATGAPYVTAFQEEPDGSLWIGSTRGLHRLDTSTGKSRHFRRNADDPGGLLSDGVFSLYEDQSGALWIGYGLHVSRFDRSTGRFRHFRHDPSNPASLSSGWILDLLEDRHGRLWIGTNRGGLDRYDPAGGVFVHYRFDPNNSSSLSDNFIRSIYEDRAEVLWIATQNGLNSIDDRQGEAAIAHYLFGREVMALLEDREGRFWVGTRGDGLHLFDRDTGTSVRYGPEEGLASANVVSLLEGDDGFLWISTADGSMTAPRRGRLSRFEADRQAFINFGPEDGLPEIGFFMNAALKSRSGRLFFGGRGGYTVFDPQDIRPPVRRVPRTTFTGLRVRNEEVAPDPEGLLKRPLHETEELRLSHDENDFTIDYTALIYRDPEETQYHYILENRDAEWVSARSQRSARYSQMPPGRYVFRVRAVDSRGMESETVSIGITILPPWWRATWAYVLYGLLFAGAVFGVDRFQRRRLIARERERARERELEQAREIEQAYGRLDRAHSELEAAHQDLKATQQQLIQQEKLASLGALTAGIAHEIKNPLNFINNFAGLTSELADDLKEAAQSGDLTDVQSIADDLALNANKIEEHGRRADGIVRSMMQHARGGSRDREAVDLNALVDEYVDLAFHGKRAQAPGFNAEIVKDFGDGIGQIDVVPQEIGRVLLNLLGNAFDAVHEHAAKIDGPHKSRVTVTTQRDDGHVNIRVADNGPGIPENVREKIFEPFFTTKAAGSGTGLGLSLSYEIVTQGHGGTLEIERGNGSGAEFIVRLPAP